MEIHAFASAPRKMSASRTGWMLACLFVGRGEKPEKPPRPSSLSRPVNTARWSYLDARAPENIYPRVQIWS